MRNHKIKLKAPPVVYLAYTVGCSAVCILQCNQELLTRRSVQCSIRRVNQPFAKIYLALWPNIGWYIFATYTNSYHLSCPFVRISHCCSSFSVDVVNKWNSVPDNVVSAISILSFKKLVKSYSYLSVIFYFCIVFLFFLWLAFVLALLVGHTCLWQLKIKQNTCKQTSMHMHV